MTGDAVPVVGAVSHRLDRAAAEPLWVQLRDDLLRRLRGGEFEADFPTELELVADYAVSRHTVRTALGKLRATGVIDSGPGRRSQPAGAREIERPVGALYALFATVRAAGITVRSRVRKCRTDADGIVARRLGLEESTPLLHLERLHLAGDEPLALDRIWLPAAVGTGLQDVDFARTGFYTALAERTGIRLVSGNERLRASVPSDNERVLLELDPSEATLSIDRLGYTAQQVLEWRSILVRGDRCAVAAEFSAQGYRFTGPEHIRRGTPR